MDRAVVSATQTIETAQRALTLCRSGNYRQATNCLFQVKRNGSLLMSTMKAVLERLSNYERWLCRHFDCQCKEKARLYTVIEKARNRKDSLTVKTQNMYADLHKNQSDYEAARRKEASAIDRKNEAEEKLYGILSLKALIPGYIIFWGIREVIEDNADVSSRAQNDILYYDRKQRESERQIDHIKNEIRMEKHRIQQFENEIQLAKSRCTQIESKLAQTRQSTQLTMKLLTLYNELADLGEDAVDNTDRLERTVALARECRSELESNGTVQDYKDSWDSLDEMLQGIFIKFEYTCSICGIHDNGIPWTTEFGSGVYCESCHNEQPK